MEAKHLKRTCFRIRIKEAISKNFSKTDLKIPKTNTPRAKRYLYPPIKRKILKKTFLAIPLKRLTFNRSLVRPNQIWITPLTKTESPTSAKTAEIKVPRKNQKKIQLDNRILKL